MSSQQQINKLLNRYPFDEEELELLFRCHEALVDNENESSFLLKMAKDSPYSFFFLPGDEMKSRVEFMEKDILPAEFGEKLEGSISSDSFVDYANEGEEKMLELFLEGVAKCCGRRGPNEAFRIIFDCCCDGDQKEASCKKLIDLCYRLSICKDILSVPNIDKSAILSRLSKHDSPSPALGKSLCGASGASQVTRDVFIQWADINAPLFASVLSSFMHTLLFHGKPFPKSRTPFLKPELYQASEIFESSDSPLLFSLASMSPSMGGKWHRLYSSEVDGRSFNRLEWSLLGYSGPTNLLIKTDKDISLGALVSTTWKDSGGFYGDSNSFLFQLEPTTKVFHPVGKDTNFIYCNAKKMSVAQDGLPKGLGFGGNTNKPRLFIPESLELCTAGYLDTTYEQGDLLPKESLEKFNIKTIEVWGVGGDEAINEALRARAEYREYTSSTINKARVVADKKQFVHDLASGVVYNSLYEHREKTRGRAEFRVDDSHDGYVLDRE
uniref:Oxidation resistance protein 1 n=1 Tax=Helicotheca tamesis TaxID=374047 RepID=A0A7S2IAT2_9STRA|mmetsp:Transcript_7437/g.10097  ORF Transcript_7437/g.10097 Transcript_7437/m.10097 type:complete len:496 (+) Transcript_7437:93-1580(+)|eukprot:CAMPEP_0185731078 /NCGR_PEP_ID=MMETSP1171-20130828/11847_1 /TAXON_ID=374046 /ORGANISM="Helicotheca tamensis, Strain CCMP826" /LENGTH=495 /DNA_ID=CAMNT_0028400263 /DNA_START=38 /DNA_END=1525 /DNA_ORIENTATION=+